MLHNLMIGDTAGHSNRTYRIIQTWPFSFSPPTHASNHPHAPGRHLPTSTYTYETQAWSACLEMTYVKETPSFTPHPSAGSEASPHFLSPLWSLGIVSLESLSGTRIPGRIERQYTRICSLPVALIHSGAHARCGTSGTPNYPSTLLLSGTCYQLAMK